MREELARLLDGLSGTVRFGDADPRWDSLLRCGTRMLGLSLSETKMLDFCDTMMRNNLDTGNFGLLIALTAGVVEEAVSSAIAAAGMSSLSDKNGSSDDTTETADGNTGPSSGDGSAGITRAMAAVRLTRLFAARMVATLDPSQLRAQVYARGKPRVGTNGALDGDLDRRRHVFPAATIVPTPAVNVVVHAGGKTGGRKGRERGYVTTTTATTAVPITEGREETAFRGDFNNGHGGGRDGGSNGDIPDPVVGILAALVYLLCVSNTGGRSSATENVWAVEGFLDLQMEGVGLLLVLLGTQVYGPPPSPLAPQQRHDQHQHDQQQNANIALHDNVFLDTLFREAGRGGGRGRIPHWGSALSRAALGWFIRRPGAPPGSAASALVNALRASPASRRSSAPFRRRPSIENSTSRRSSKPKVQQGRLFSSGDDETLPLTATPTATSALEMAASSSTTHRDDGEGDSSHPNQKEKQQQQAGKVTRLIAAPGALVLFVARALLYVLTLRGLIGVAGVMGGGGRRETGLLLGDGGDDGHDGGTGGNEEVTEALGGPPAEPGEWEGHPTTSASAGGGGGSRGGVPEKLSPLADRGVLLLLVLLHNRRSPKSTPATTPTNGTASAAQSQGNNASHHSRNAFLAAVASCVDADLDDNVPVGDHGGTVGSTSNGSGKGSPAYFPPSPSATTEPMRVSFRGLFEAFASSLEAPSSRGSGGSGSKGGGSGAGGRGGGGGGIFGLDFNGGWNRGAGGESIGCKGAALLLYSLLQANPGFLRAAVVRSDADALLLPLLRTLHDCASPSSKAAQSPAEERKRNTQRKEREKQQQQRQRLESQAPTYAQRGADVVGSSSPSLYVPAIVILLFSQDAAFDRQSFRQVVQREIRFGSSRNSKGSSLGSLIVLSVLRCLGHNLSRLKDGYLLENCLAVLINLAPQAEHLQPYAAQRLVSVLVAASRRWTEGASAAAAAAEAGRSARNGAQNGDRNSSGGAGLDMGAGVDHGEEDFVGGLSDVQELCGEVARVLFLFVWRCTRPRRLGSNVELLYALLHEQVNLDAVCNHPALAATGWAGDLPRLLAHFQDLAKKEEEAGGAGLTVETAMKMVEKGARHYATEAMGMGQEGGGDAAEDGRGAGAAGAHGMEDEDDVVTLLYEEGENPEAFFLPYLWELLLARTPDLNWTIGRIRISPRGGETGVEPVQEGFSVVGKRMGSLDAAGSWGDAERGGGRPGETHVVNVSDDSMPLLSARETGAGDEDEIGDLSV